MDWNFPYQNDLNGGFFRTSPVGSFPANGRGLFELGGNVWNWSSNLYSGDAFRQRAKEAGLCSDSKGPLKSRIIPGHPSTPNVPETSQKLMNRGSFLRRPDNCESCLRSAR